MPDAARSEAPAPPNLRESESDSDEQCGNCKMFDSEKSVCWGYGNYQVESGWLCDSYAPEPTSETKSTLGEAHMTTVAPNLTEHTAEWREQRAKALASAERRPSAWRRETSAPLELRDADESTGVRVLRSYASLFNTPYTIRSSSHKFEESVRQGAFRRSLHRGPDVVFRTDHHGPPLGRTTANSLRLGEDERGLWYEVDLNLADPDVQSLIPKIERGDYSESSFAFRCIDDFWSEDFSERELRECELDRGDVSVVTFGASRATGQHMLLRSEEALQKLHEIGFERVMAALVEWRDFTLFPPEQRLGKVLSSQSMETLRQVLGLLSDADDRLDEALGEAQSMLADLMGVPNPKDGGALTDSEQLTHVGRSEEEGDQDLRAHDSPVDGDTERTVPHLLDTVLVDLAHARQHADRLFDSEVLANSDSQQFNAEHMSKHLDGAQEHALKLDQHLSEYPSNPEIHRSERERLTSMRNEETAGNAEERNDPTYEDYDVMYGLKNVKVAIACVKACQLADPDGDTDPDDQAVMAGLNAADGAIDEAIKAQGRDGRPDPDDDERAQVKDFWTQVEEKAGSLGITLTQDAEGITARMDVDDTVPEVRRTFSAEQREKIAAKNQETVNVAGHMKGASGVASQTRVALAENDSDDLFVTLKLRSAR